MRILILIIKALCSLSPLNITPQFLWLVGVDVDVDLEVVDANVVLFRKWMHVSPSINVKRLNDVLNAVLI